MVYALVNIDENTNRALNVVKAKYGLRNKGEAIRVVVTSYVESEEPELRPEFVAKMQRIAKQKSIRVDDFSARYRL